jgi:hypothetical protein
VSRELAAPELTWGALVAVRGEHALAKAVLVQPLLHEPAGIPSLRRIGESQLGCMSESQLGLQFLCRPLGYEGRPNGSVTPGRYAEEIEDWNLCLLRHPQPAVVGGVRIVAHEGVVDDLFAALDLFMDLPLIVIPHSGPGPRKDGPNAEQVVHRSRLEDAALRVDQRDPLPSPGDGFAGMVGAVRLDALELGELVGLALGADRPVADRAINASGLCVNVSMRACATVIVDLSVSVLLLVT